MTAEQKSSLISSLNREGQFAFVYPTELHELEKKGASAQDITEILTCQATINEKRSKLQLPPLPCHMADELFFLEPAAVCRDFPGAVFDKVCAYWHAPKSQTARDFWEQTRDDRREIAGILLELGEISQSIHDFLTAD